MTAASREMPETRARHPYELPSFILSGSANFADNFYHPLIRRLYGVAQPVHEQVVVHFQKSIKQYLLFAIQQVKPALQKSCKHKVKFPRSPPAPPYPSLFFRMNHCPVSRIRYSIGAGDHFLSCMVFLICAIALAGFRPFGQVFVQFIIVWQRYSLKASSNSSSRSPVASSRLSAIQR